MVNQEGEKVVVIVGDGRYGGFDDVHARHIARIRKKIQFEEKWESNQRRVLTDSETVRWLNHTVEKIWPMCMELQITSQAILLPIIPWFLEKYKPWTAKKALIQHLYLGRNPPIFTEMGVLQKNCDDDHLVLELGMNFLTADDTSAVLAVQLRKRLGFGMWTKLHLTSMHLKGKVVMKEHVFIGLLLSSFSCSLLADRQPSYVYVSLLRV